MTAPTAHERVFCALDTTDMEAALRLARSVRGAVGGLKLGLEFFSARGRDGFAALAAAGLPIFLDLKLHDIPNTVAGAVRALTPLGPAFMTIHAQGGLAMMRAAREAAAEAAAAAGVVRPKLLAVTVLTSLDDGDLGDLGIAATVSEQVLRLAGLAAEAGLDGVICSPHEIASLRARFGPDFILMVPGIRPAGAAIGDQKRVMSPAEAIAAGASYLVIGRPISAAADPAAAARAIAAELAALA